MEDSKFDVIIVGAGPAGLSAALVLGRCRRRVLICDAGQPRNGASHGLHLFLTRDGIEPAEFLSIARAQLKPYATVEFRRGLVTQARRIDDHFEIVMRHHASAGNGEKDERLVGRKILLATGVTDELPQIKGIEEFYGTSVFHCPYCDGWEMRDRAIAVYGRGENGSGLAVELMLWSRDVVLCTDGPSELTTENRERLARHNISIREEPIERLEGRDGQVEKIVFRQGEPLAVNALFFSTGQHQGSDLAKQLGCSFNEQDCVDTGDYEVTSVPGVYAAGDASRLVQFVIVAASEGAQAAVAINKELIKEDLEG